MKVIVNQIKNKKGVSDIIEKTVLFLSKKEKKVKGEVEINIVGNRTIKVFNKKYRGIDRPTDVLSFAWQEDKDWPTNSLGQIYLSISKIKEQAKEFGVSEKEEMVRMLIHGVLHLVGYDHQDEKTAKKMFTKQEGYLKNILKMI